MVRASFYGYVWYVAFLLCVEVDMSVPEKLKQDALCSTEPDQWLDLIEEVEQLRSDLGRAKDKIEELEDRGRYRPVVRFGEACDGRR